ncbi:hypothetical protein EDF52_113109 [Curtobacterium sp. PhB42]|nr:hypothetical protein EDF52_113109 [Curtobacterium sp. PhB42]TDW53547.1 hypothetical protein EDF47_10959 [Curtobacterium sp. PhB190]
MAIHPAIVLTCDGYQCSEKLALIGPNAVSYGGARGHAESYGWDCSVDDVDWCPNCRAAQAALDSRDTVQGQR